MKDGITPNLWFNNCAEAAVNYYLSVFSDGKMIRKDFYTEVGEEMTKHKKGEILSIEFEIMHTRFIAINAGPEFMFNPSISLMIRCDTQEEIDYYWHKLSYSEHDEQCGWIKDTYGISWQIVPTILEEMLRDGNELQRKKVTEAFMKMKKFEIEKLKAAYVRLQECKTESILA